MVSLHFELKVLYLLVGSRLSVIHSEITFRLQKGTWQLIRNTGVTWVSHPIYPVDVVKLRLREQTTQYKGTSKGFQGSHV